MAQMTVAPKLLGPRCPIHVCSTLIILTAHLEGPTTYHYGTLGSLARGSNRGDSTKVPIAFNDIDQYYNYKKPKHSRTSDLQKRMFTSRATIADGSYDDSKI